VIHGILDTVPIPVRKYKTRLYFRRDATRPALGMTNRYRTSSADGPTFAKAVWLHIMKTFLTSVIRSSGPRPVSDACRLWSQTLPMNRQWRALSVMVANADDTLQSTMTATGRLRCRLEP